MAMAMTLLIDSDQGFTEQEIRDAVQQCCVHGGPAGAMLAILFIRALADVPDEKLNRSLQHASITELSGFLFGLACMWGCAPLSFRDANDPEYPKEAQGFTQELSAAILRLSVWKQWAIMSAIMLLIGYLRSIDETKIQPRKIIYDSGLLKDGPGLQRATRYAEFVVSALYTHLDFVESDDVSFPPWEYHLTLLDEDQDVRKRNFHRILEKQLVLHREAVLGMLTTVSAIHHYSTARQMQISLLQEPESVWREIRDQACKLLSSKLFNMGLTSALIGFVEWHFSTPELCTGRGGSRQSVTAVKASPQQIERLATALAALTPYLGVLTCYATVIVNQAIGTLSKAGHLVQSEAISLSTDLHVPRVNAFVMLGIHLANLGEFIVKSLAQTGEAHDDLERILANAVLRSRH